MDARLALFCVRIGALFRQQQPDESELFVRGPVRAAFVAGTRLVYLRADGAVGVASLQRTQAGGAGDSDISGAVSLLPSALDPTLVPCPPAVSVSPISSCEIAIVTAAGHLLLHSLLTAAAPGVPAPAAPCSTATEGSLHAQIQDLAALAEQSTAVQHLAQARGKPISCLF